MVNIVTIPPLVAPGVDALSNLPSPSDALSMFGNNIAGGLTDAINALAGSSGATDTLDKISSILGGSPPVHDNTADALVPIQDMYTPIITTGAQSTDMTTHVGALQKSMPLVLKKASTANAMIVATEYTSPDCSSKIIFPLGASSGDATAAVAGTSSGKGDELQGDATKAINDLVEILDAPLGSPATDSYTIGLNKVLDTIIAGDNSVDYSDILLPYTPTDAMTGAHGNITTKGNLIDETVLNERANIGLPLLAVPGETIGEAIIINGETIVPAGDPDTIQMGAGLVTADIKKKSLGLQAHAMACTPCQKDILTRSEPTEPDAIAGVSSIAAKADEVSVKDENDFSVANDPTIEVVAASVAVVEEADQAAVNANDVASADSVVWKSETQKITALVYNSEEGLTFILELVIPEQSSAMVVKFPKLSTIATQTLHAEWTYPESMVMTDFWGNNMMKNSMKGSLSAVVGSNLYLELVKAHGKLSEYGISVFKNFNTELDAAVYNYIPDPDLVDFGAVLRMDIDGLDPTTDSNSVGNCKTVVFDGNIKKSTEVIGPVDGNDTGFWFVKSHVNTNTAFTTWIEGPDTAMKDAAVQYINKLTT